MKHLLILASLLLCFTNLIYSAERDLPLDSGRKYICYELGNFYAIYIADGDSICDVIVHDSRGSCDSTTCQKSPILKWAFDDMGNETTKSPAIPNNAYGPLYYTLSILSDGSSKTISSSMLITDYSDDVERKIKELKTFIIQLWIPFIEGKQ
nr:hypothetical protein [Bacteroides sp.]